jgi:hypothetical protein
MAPVKCWNDYLGETHENSAFIFIDPEGETDALPLCSICMMEALTACTIDEQAQKDVVKFGPIVRLIDDSAALGFLGFGNGAG